jgi:2-phospho-L-lactate/phosphoenolpyruvate guanylyltransferase
MNLAVVPVKRLAAGKSRLRESLGAGRVEALALAMLGDVVDAIRASGCVDRIVVATPDAEVGDAARALGAEARVADDAGLSAALDATAAAHADPSGALLVVLGDVAGATGRDVAALFAALGDREGVVLAPARDGGTAALLRRPPGAIPSCFGPDSAKAHCAAAERAGVAFRELPLPSLAIDLDRESDLAALLASDLPAKRTRAALGERG